MTESGSKYMTERQRYWLKHIQAYEASRKRIAEYAADQQIDAKAGFHHTSRDPAIHALFDTSSDFVASSVSSLASPSPT